MCARIKIVWPAEKTRWSNFQQENINALIDWKSIRNTLLFLFFFLVQFKWIENFDERSEQSNWNGPSVMESVVDVRNVYASFQ